MSDKTDEKILDAANDYGMALSDWALAPPKKRPKADEVIKSAKEKLLNLVESHASEVAREAAQNAALTIDAKLKRNDNPSLEPGLRYALTVLAALNQKGDDGE